MAVAPSHFGSGKFGAGKFSQGSAVVTSRAYGLGPYGTGRYGVGTGTNFEVAAQSQIAFSVGAKPSVIYAAGSRTKTKLLPQARAARLWSATAATQIQFSLKGVAYTVHLVGAGTQISFSVQGELVKTWQDPGPCFVPCEAGSWTQVFPPWVVREAA